LNNTIPEKITLTKTPPFQHFGECEIHAKRIVKEIGESSEPVQREK
jgi:hypothetical protein